MLYHCAKYEKFLRNRSWSFKCVAFKYIPYSVALNELTQTLKATLQAIPEVILEMLFSVVFGGRNTTRTNPQSSGNPHCRRIWKYVHHTTAYITSPLSQLHPHHYPIELKESINNFKRLTDVILIKNVLCH